MTIRKRFGSPIAAGLALLMMLPFGDIQDARAQQAPATQQGQPDSAAAPNQAPAADPNTSSGAAEQNPPDAPTRSSSPASDAPASSDSQNGETKPLGTAAAPYTKTSGVMGSRPAGAVIAPAKQRRVHAILISVAIIAGAGIALGTVAALSKGSPSRP
jgi:hypothetical protein